MHSLFLHHSPFLLPLLLLPFPTTRLPPPLFIRVETAPHPSVCSSAAADERPSKERTATCSAVEHCTPHLTHAKQDSSCEREYSLTESVVHYHTPPRCMNSHQEYNGTYCVALIFHRSIFANFKAFTKLFFNKILRFHPQKSKSLPYPQGAFCKKVLLQYLLQILDELAITHHCCNFGSW